MPLGNGSPLHGPIGLGTAATHSAEPAAAATAHASEGPLLVRVQDLSEHPVPPALEGLLRQNYPAEARQRGLRGSARVRARIDPDGLIRSAQVLSESSSGFGVACQRTVLGSRWSAPRSQNGAAVATEIVYTCHFEVDG
jgi:TonB family protein